MKRQSSREVEDGLCNTSCLLSSPARKRREVVLPHPEGPVTCTDCPFTKGTRVNSIEEEEEEEMLVKEEEEEEEEEEVSK